MAEHITPFGYKIQRNHTKSELEAPRFWLAFIVLEVTRRSWGEKSEIVFPGLLQ